MFPYPKAAHKVYQVFTAGMLTKLLPHLTLREKGLSYLSLIVVALQSLLQTVLF